MSETVEGLRDQLALFEKRCADLEAKFALLSLAKATDGGKPDEKLNDAKASTVAGETSPAVEPPLPRVKIVTSMRDEDGEAIEKTTEPKKKDNSAEALGFILKKFVGSKFSEGGGDESEINIVNPHLWNLLKSQLGWYPYHVFRGSAVTLVSPFEHIVHQWDSLWEEANRDGSTDDDKQAREDLKSLLEIISGGKSGDSMLDKYFQNRKTYNENEEKTVQFEDLWTVFPPGTLVYGRPFQNQDQIFVVKDSYDSWPIKRNGEYLHFSLQAWSYDWKDDSFARKCFNLKIQPFEGYRPLTSLEYFPFDLHPAKDKIREELIARGKKFRDFCTAREGSRMFEYHGHAITEKKGFSGMSQDDDIDSMSDVIVRQAMMIGMDPVQYVRLRRPHAISRVLNSITVNGRVMVDYASYFQYGSTNGRNGDLEMGYEQTSCTCSDCKSNEELAQRYRTRFDEEKQSSASIWEDEQYLMCPPRVLGYILQEKQWAQLGVQSLQPITVGGEQDTWKSRLKLADENTKHVLFDLVRSHKSNSNHGGSATQNRLSDKVQGLEVDDIVPGKGKGLVILLYGPPGVGKTSTAETIAMASGKPLFSVSVADVGTQAKHVEANLSKIFSLATIWQAILLIDEADVFLESRGRGGMVQSTEKNALVSVFLRVLEYYQGIMFLTTNQIADFDIAIPSRIHFAIKYESLNHAQMEAIFKGFLTKLNEHNLIEDYDDILEWLKEDVYSEGFDGRQLRNVVTTALSLARADDQKGKGNGKLTKSHMKKAFSNVKQFKRDFSTQMQRYKDSQLKMIK
ncbi:uncharacterized protein B0I36DRAFT_321640 [Microdochium trichocladiopsis]|uniref:AAA+ ATPase domain-containing protein n=1 Tax=Microdochium trichocladiopsis TaxID=1682393 RepID=A0A9P9BPW4_9PEZI|nr:uncharacterized protein B0I36DRAFT_321640 [Microdochium trichocladiopsis]KAH7033534.1 hypothetical protein B0I36DRAFT_321640 [Microdochium trichocladiopsis]